MKAISVLIVDDHNLVCNGVKFILQENEQHYLYDVIDTAYSGIEALEKQQNHNYDVVLLDLVMPNMSGQETCARLIENKPDQKVLGFSMHCSIDRVKSIIDAGACGFISKDCGAEVLIRALHAVAEGKRYFCNEAAQILLENDDFIAPDETYESKADLTRREREILRMIFDEKTNEEIGLELHLSKRTVDTHRQNILKKLGVKNTAGLIRYAIDNGIGELKDE